jgi:monomeric isocitrate dehydrogenase
VNINTSVSFPSAAVELDPEGRLAMLVLEQQKTKDEGAHDEKTLARQRFKEATEHEVDAMRDKAGHILNGALAQGTATLTGAGVQFADGLDGVKNRIADAGVAGANGMAPVMGKILGDQPAASDDANAKQASALAEQARWAMDDANTIIERAQSTSDKVVDWVSSINAGQASAETGIIAGLA